MFPQEGSTDWEHIFNETFLYRDKCWTTCGGGYCCKPNRVQKNFSILRQVGVEIPMLPGEYHFLVRKGWLQAGFDKAVQRHVVQLPGGVNFPIYRTVCKLDGHCSDHIRRPVVCRTYPFAPVPAVDGRVESFEPVAVIDLFWDVLNTASDPCTVAPMTASETPRFTALCEDLLKDPVNIFYLRAAHLFKKAVKEGVVNKHPQLLDMQPDQFFKTWEQLFVFGLIYDQGALLTELQDLYNDLKAHYGSRFTLENL